MTEVMPKPRHDVFAHQVQNMTMGHDKTMLWLNSCGDSGFTSTNSTHTPFSGHEDDMNDPMMNFDWDNTFGEAFADEPVLTDMNL